MKRTKTETKKNILNKIFFNKLIVFTSILVSFIALALPANASTVRVQSGALNISNNLLVNSNTLFVDSANNKVGIGIATPSAALEINGANDVQHLKVFEDDATPTQNIVNITRRNNLAVAIREPTRAALFIQDHQADYPLYIVNQDETALLTMFGDGSFNLENQFVYNGTSNSVGIGTTSPGSPLHVVGQTRVDRAAGGLTGLSLRDTTNGINRNFCNDNGLLQFSGSNQACSVQSDLVITTAGKVGIGTTNPASTLTVIGNFSATGTKAAVINTSYGAIAFYAMESSEVRLYDEGTSSLQSGSKLISLDSIFAEAIDTSSYLVYVTPLEDSNGLYVTQKTSTSFLVKENKGGASNIEFSYIISGKRKDFKDVRLYKFPNFDFGRNKSLNETTII